MQLRDLFDDLPISKSDVVPLALQKLLNEPLDIYVDWQRTEQLLLEAREMMPERLEIAVALYKMYAYANYFDQSMGLINEVLCKTSVQMGFVSDWRNLTSDSAAWSNATGDVRLYLYSLKAMGFVLLRMGDVKKSYEVLQKLLELDPQDQVGGSVVYEMAERILEQELEDVA